MTAINLYFLWLVSKTYACFTFLSTLNVSEGWPFLKCLPIASTLLVTKEHLLHPQLKHRKIILFLYLPMKRTAGMCFSRVFFFAVVHIVLICKHFFTAKLKFLFYSYVFLHLHTIQDSAVPVTLLFRLLASGAIFLKKLRSVMEGAIRPQSGKQSRAFSSIKSSSSSVLKVPTFFCVDSKLLVNADRLRRHSSLRNLMFHT